MFRLRAESVEFLETAPKRWTFEGGMDATAEAVFDALSADPST